jgi:hypothetical protein
VFIQLASLYNEKSTMGFHELLQSGGKPLPYGYRWLVEGDLTDFGPWYLIDEQSESDGLWRQFIRDTSAPHLSVGQDFQPCAAAAAVGDKHVLLRTRVNWLAPRMLGYLVRLYS